MTIHPTRKPKHPAAIVPKDASPLKATKEFSKAHFVQPRPTFFASLGRNLRLLWQKTPFYTLNLMGKAPHRLQTIPTDPWPGDMAHGRLMLEGKIVLGRTVMPMTELWAPRTITQEQFFQLHNFEWLRDLRAVGDNTTRRFARQIILHWIENNQNWKAASWKPEIIGYRLANWIGLYEFFCASADESFRHVFFKSLSKQLKHLARNWQDAPTSIQRFFGLYGLIFATVSISDTGHRLPKLLAALDLLLQEQILSDGGHASRSPTLQIILLRMLIDIRSLLRTAAIPVPESLQRAINRMAPLVRLFRHGDGGIASFDGMASLSPTFIDMILSLADVRGKPPARALAMGYERCVTKAGLVLFNAAPIAANPLPESIEQSTGILNFEWSIGRERIVTTGDLVLQTPKAYCFRARSSDPCCFVQRRMNDKDVFLDATYHGTDVHGTFLHHRQLYLTGESVDFRGEEYLEASVETLYGIRFILSPNFYPQLSSNGQNVTLRLADNRLLRLAATGHTEIVMTHLADLGQAPCIMILGQLPAGKAQTIRWSFSEV